jgi:hypothetical protein
MTCEPRVGDSFQEWIAYSVGRASLTGEAIQLDLNGTPFEVFPDDTYESALARATQVYGYPIERRYPPAMLHQRAASGVAEAWAGIVNTYGPAGVTPTPDAGGTMTDWRQEIRDAANWIEGAYDNSEAQKANAATAERLRAIAAGSFGFTWDHVDRLRETAYNVPNGWSPNLWLHELADLIAALLPPRGQR